MRNICQYEGYPRKEEIPDQAGVSWCICVGHPCRNEKDTGKAGYVKQEKYSNAVPVSKDKIFEFVIH